MWYNAYQLLFYNAEGLLMKIIGKKEYWTLFYIVNDTSAYRVAQRKSHLLYDKIPLCMRMPAAARNNVY